MNTWVNIVLTGLIAGLSAVAPLVAAVNANVAVAMGVAAAVLKVVDGYFTPSAPSATPVAKKE